MCLACLFLVGSPNCQFSRRSVHVRWLVPHAPTTRTVSNGPFLFPFSSSFVLFISALFFCDFLQGLALSLFMFAVMGNVTQVMSIVLYSIEPDYLIGQLPYLLGRSVCQATPHAPRLLR